MFPLPTLRRYDDRPCTRRSRTAPRPRLLVEDLEGRQLLSTVTGADFSLNFTKINANASVVQGQHIAAAPSGIQGNHIGTSAAVVVGHHLVGSVTEAVGGDGLGAGANTVRFFEFDSTVHDLQPLQLQSAMQNENRQFTATSNMTHGGGTGGGSGKV
jgi:hypothetical protein